MGGLDEDCTEWLKASRSHRATRFSWLLTAATSSLRCLFFSRADQVIVNLLSKTSLGLTHVKGNVDGRLLWRGALATQRKWERGTSAWSC